MVSVFNSDQHFYSGQYFDNGQCFYSDDIEGQKHPVTSPAARSLSTVYEPSVDFELDIKVDIDSGQCVLHPKEPKADEAELRRYDGNFVFQNLSVLFHSSLFITAIIVC